MPERPRRDHLGHRRHADDVGAERAQHGDLGRRLVARAEQPRVRPVGDERRRPRRPPHSSASVAQLGIVGVAHRHERVPPSGPGHPTSGLSPVRLMWSLMSTMSPADELPARSRPRRWSRRASRRPSAARQPHRERRPPSPRTPGSNGCGPGTRRRACRRARPMTSWPAWPTTCRSGSGNPSISAYGNDARSLDLHRPSRRDRSRG